MFRINPITKEIKITRGDYASIDVTAQNDDGSDYVFKIGDVVRLKVFEKKKCNCVVLKKDKIISEETTMAQIILEKEDTKIGDPISKSCVYWYEIELNPDTKPQTIIGYDYNEEKDEEDPKIFRLLPEGSDEE